MSVEPTPSGHETSFRQVRRGYVLALGIIAALTLSAQAIIQHTLGRQLADAEIINVAGRQRMLSQHIARSALELAAGAVEDERAALRRDLRALELSHRRLMEGDLSKFTSVLTPPQRDALDAAAHTLIEAGRTVAYGAEAATPQGELPVTSAAAAAFLPKMDAAVFAFSAASEESVRQTRRIEVGLALCTLAALLLEALLIFGPLLRRLQGSVSDLETVTTRLFDSEARLERALNGSRDGLWDWARGHETVFFSERFRQLAGLSETDTTWAALEARLSPIDRDKLREGLSGPDLDLEARIMLDDGPRWVRLRGLGDGADHMSGTLSDVDERRRLEDEREQRLEARDRDLAEVRDDLARAELMTAIGTLASGVAHDFNNYLQVIQLASESIDRDGDDAVLLDAIQEAAEEASTLTQQLLSLRREHAGEMYEVFDLGSLVQDGLSLVRPALPANVELVTEVERPLKHVRADRSQLRQVLVNLCVNAKDAMPNGGKLFISVAAAQRRSVDGAAEGVELIVADEGEGMTAEVKRRLFEPFFTTKGGGQRADHGTGLGLAMVHSIIRRHGGSIDVDSTPGQGARLRVWLPAYAGPEVANRGRTHWRRPSEALEILYVDDEAPIREIGRRLLERSGHRIREAGGVKEAIEVAADTPQLDLVICDVMMPDGLGPDAVKEIRRARPGRLPVLFVSGYTERPVDLDEASAFLRKPFTSSELLDAIDQLLSRAPARRTTATASADKPS